MGNRWHNQDTVINPKDAPYKHLTSIGGTYSYAPSVGTPLSIRLLSGTLKVDEIIRIVPSQISPLEKVALEVELLPPLEQIPPEPIEVSAQVEQVVKRLFSKGDYNLAGLLSENPDVGTIALTHGRVWECKIVDAIAQYLREDGYQVYPSYPMLPGKNHRIQTYLILIKREESAPLVLTPQRNTIFTYIKNIF
jgi:hypothetical protein